MSRESFFNMSMPVGADAVVLDPRENDRIFRQRIVPGELAHVVAQENPRVVFVIGQPGAGKTNTSDVIRSGLDAAGHSGRVDSDVFKTYHPDYDRLMAEDDSTAAVRVSPDGRLWTGKAENYLIGRRANILIEETVRNPPYFLGPQLARFREAGYRVEVAFLAVAQAWSRWAFSPAINGRWRAREPDD